VEEQKQFHIMDFKCFHISINHIKGMFDIPKMRAEIFSECPPTSKAVDRKLEKIFLFTLII